MTSHWKNRFSSAIPDDCISEGRIIELYPVTDTVGNLDTLIKGQVCDYLNYVGGDNLDNVQITISGEISGDTGCDKVIPLEKSYRFNCDTYKDQIKFSKETKNIKIKEGVVRKINFLTKKQDGVGSVQDISLHLDSAASRDQRIFPAELNDRSQKGCGRKTAQNVLRFFGVNLSQGEIAKDILGHSIKEYAIAGRTENIATYPSELRKGLQKILNKHGLSSIKVERYSGKNQNDIIKYLKLGSPVIALVNGGNHWVSITGVKSSRFPYPDTETANYQKLFYVQNLSHNEIWNWRSLSLQFDDRSDLWSGISDTFGGTSFKEGTIIVFENLSIYPELITPVNPIRINDHNIRVRF